MASSQFDRAKRSMSYSDFFKLEGKNDNAFNMVRGLESLMKSLTKYIEEKREQFARFYFLSNEQIIEMCGVMQDISNLEKNFHKMFEGINRLIIVYREHQMT